MNFVLRHSRFAALLESDGMLGTVMVDDVMILEVGTKKW